MLTVVPSVPFAPVVDATVRQSDNGGADRGGVPKVATGLLGHFVSSAGAGVGSSLASLIAVSTCLTVTVW